MLARGGAPLVEDWQNIDLSPPQELLTRGERDFYAAALESPLIIDPKFDNITDQDMNLCAESSELQLLLESDFDILTFANNHQNDCIDTGASETQRILEESGFSAFQQSDEMWIYTLDDPKLVLIAIDDVSSAVNREIVTEKIRAEKMDGKFVIISAHWGNEYQAGPDERQRSLAQSWVDAGADIIWGHHPHVLQRVEWLTSYEDKHTALVMYSLGNLLADQFMLEDTQRSALIKVVVINDQISKITIIPVRFDWKKLSLDFELEVEETTSILERLNLIPLDTVEVTVYPSGN